MNLIPFWNAGTIDSFWNCLHNIVRGIPAIWVFQKELIILIINKQFYIAVTAIFKIKVFLDFFFWMNML